MQDNGRDASHHDAYDVSDGRWLTYAELAKLRGIDRASAFKLAMRHKWRRQKNNKGQVAVLVPFDFTGPEDESPDNGYDASYRASFDSALAAVREAHAGEVAALRGQVDAARADADMSRDMADKVMTQLAEAASEISQLRNRLDEAEHRARTAEGEVQELRQADEKRRGRGRWARLRAAWRGE